MPLRKCVNMMVCRNSYSGTNIYVTEASGQAIRSAPTQTPTFSAVDVFCKLLIDNTIYFEPHYRVFWSKLIRLDKQAFVNLRDGDVGVIIRLQAHGGERLKNMPDKIHNKVCLQLLNTN